jgi:predicted outer membrane repeat protein
LYHNYSTKFIINNRLPMKNSNSLIFSSIYFLFLGLNLTYAQYDSSILFHNNLNQLSYVSDKDGNHIPDFSFAGYKNGEAELPNVAVVKQISAVVGDNTAHIQAAIDEVEALPLNANGHRGVLLLSAGEYRVSGVLTINTGGVVLRGSGDGEDPLSNTVIIGVGNTPIERTLITVGTNIKNGFKPEVAGTRQNIISPYIPAGSRTIEVTDASVFRIGDNIIIRHPSTSEWLKKVEYGGVGSDAPWQPGEIDLVFNRYITKIDGNKIQVNTPIYDVLDQSLSQSFVYKNSGNSQIKECGIENLRIFVESSGVTGRNHVKTCINMVGVDNSWIKGVTTLRMSYSGVKFDEATRCSVVDTKVLEVHGPISGGWRYNFNVGDHCNNILFNNCTASDGRHSFVSNGASDVNGIVFTNCSSTGDYTSSESHRRWGQGMLFDNISWRNTNAYFVLGLHNRGSYGTGHGWTLTNGVAWNIDAPANLISVQKPPIGQNYAIGCNANEVSARGPFLKPVGYIEGTGETLKIPSLYAAQLEDRTTHGILPDTPGKLSIIDYKFSDTEKYVELSWFDISIEETDYILERSSDGITFQIIATLTANTESYTDSDLQQADYFYRIKARNAIGTSPASNTTQPSDSKGPSTYYVKADGLNSNDGLSEASAFPTLNTAIATAIDGDTIIVVGSISQVEQVTLSKSVYFVGQNNATINGVDGGTVAKMYELTAAGLTISFTDIIFQGSTNKTGSNGAVFSITGDSDIYFSNCIFDGNSTLGDFQGGAIYVSNGRLNITDSLFKNNTAGKSGGAIYVNAIQIPIVNIAGSTFYNNLAQGTLGSDGGGAILSEGVAVSPATTPATYTGQVTITNSTFFENKTTKNSVDYGAIRSTNTNVSVTNSLFYNNKINGGEGASSDFGSSPGGTQSFTYSIGEWISSNVDTRSNFISYVKGTTDPNEIAANLTASNLRFDAELGKVIYQSVDPGIDSPIAFGDDGNDAGAWDSESTLNVEDSVLKNLIIFYKSQTKRLEIQHSSGEALNIEIYNMLGAKVFTIKNIRKTQSIYLEQLKNGIYILVGKVSGKTFSRKILISG